MSDKKAKQALRDAAGYYGVRGAMALVDVLPVGVAHGFARLGADLAFAMARRRRRIATGNILYAGITADKVEARRIARASFRHFAAMVVDVNKSLAGLSEDELCADVELVAPPETLDILNDPSRGMLLLSGHIGNWEVAGQRIAVAKRTLVIAKKAKNERVQSLMESRQVRPLYEVIDKQGADMRMLAKAAKGGAAVGMVVDQHARGTTGMMMPVFGHEASVHVSPAVFYRMAKVPIVMFEPIVVGPMKFELTLSEPLTFEMEGSREVLARRIMARYIEWLEGAIRRHPEQYLWAHRRWRDVGFAADSPRT